MLKTICLILCCLSSASVLAQFRVNKIIACVDHFPPYLITNTQKITGEHIVALELLSQAMELQLRFETHATFTRCLNMLIKGQVDIMVGLIDKPERKKHLLFFPFREDTTYIFLTRPSGPKINRLEDLSLGVIGITRGASHFPEFDNNQAFSKIQLPDTITAIRMMLQQRVDIVISSPSAYLAILNNHPSWTNKIQPARYHHPLQRDVHFALSKRSPYAKNIDSFIHKTQQLRKQNAFSKAIKDFILTHPDYYTQAPLN